MKIWRYGLGAIALALLITPHNPLHSATDRATIGASKPAQVSWRRVWDRGSSVLAPSRAVISRDGFAVFLKVDELSAIFSTSTESRYGFPGHSPEGDMNLRRGVCNRIPPEYLVIRDELAAYSCEKGNNIVYYVARYSDYGGVYLEVTYPKAKKNEFDPIVARMSSSMTQVPRFIVEILE